MPTILTVRDLTYELPNGRRLLHGLTFSLESKLTGLVGPNGVGKSTLARLLAGELKASAGSVQSVAAVSYLPQRELPPPLSVAEYLGEPEEWSEWLEELLYGIARKTPCPNLSGGEWMRVRLAQCLTAQFLILDEPTNDLDQPSRRAVLRFLRQREEGALLISHDRECLGVCNEVLELSQRGLAKFGGNFQAYCEQKARERQRLGDALDAAKRARDETIEQGRQQKARQEKRNRQGAAAARRGGLPKILLGGRKRKAQATTGKVDSMAIERAATAVREIHFALDQIKAEPVMYAELLGQPLPGQKLVAEATDFNLRYERWLFPRNLTFSWRGNVRVAIRGNNGSGKTSLLRALLGEPIESRGQLRRGQLTTLYLDQKGGALQDEQTILENVRASVAGDEGEIRSGLARFLFAREAVFQKVETLSGGERLRVALARAFLSAEKPELLVLDEPTNNLDLANLDFLENLVSQFRGALIVVSHDEAFLQKCGVKAGLNLSE